MTAEISPVVVLATNNPGKLREFVRLLGDGLALSLETVSDRTGVSLRVEETGATFHENAELKARAASEATGCPALADDSGLEVDALAGAPGVLSARYGGEGASDQKNNQKLLSALHGAASRRARFRCVLALVEPGTGRVRFSEGSCEGVIAESARGSAGFGYDPIFLPDGFGGKSFAELTAAEKDAVSHRGRALAAMRELLDELVDEL